LEKLDGVAYGLDLWQRSGVLSQDAHEGTVGNDG
jgi:hypothetical protein